MPVHLSREGRVATLTIDRPPLNILDLETLADLQEAVRELAALAEDGVALAVVRGAGERAFSAGVAVQDHAAALVPTMLARFHDAVRRLRALPAVSLAAVRGHCLGGGFELATSCDLVLAADDARFGTPEVKLGCFPPVATAMLPQRLGRARALELILTGRTLSCKEAEALGLVERRVPPEELEQALAAFAAELTAGSAAVARLIKKAVHAGADLPFEAALEEGERIYLEELVPTEDMDEGLTAFLEKRQPVWKDR